ncbi:hypothetical protein EV426DRAFT_707233 [Tirmania nivea]|nr:hypothetical protein EV426DRAFT_707233 [Tirmania nivea]
MRITNSQTRVNTVQAGEYQEEEGGSGRTQKVSNPALNMLIPALNFKSPNLFPLTLRIVCSSMTLAEKAGDLEGKGDFAVWRRKLGEGDLEATCRSCRKYEESGSHVALVCCEGEWMGRRFGSWEDIDRVKELVRKEMVDGKEVPVDLAEVFFSRLRSC